MGLSIQQVADVTRISPRALEALENNDASNLPGGIFSRGFVRTYARHVGLDADAAVGRFLQMFPDDSQTEDKLLAAWQAHEAAQARPSRKPTLMNIGGLVAIGVVVVAAFWLWPMLAGTPVPDGGTAPGAAAHVDSDPGTESSLAPVVEAAPPASAVAAETAPPFRPDIPASVSAAPSSMPEPLSGDPNGAPPPDPLLAGPAPAKASQAAPAPPQSLEVVIEPVATCWVRLMVDGEFAFARVLRPGEREARTATDSVVFDIGDASAFRFSVNGVPGRLLGRKGQVVTARISRENVSSFLSQ